MFDLVIKAGRVIDGTGNPWLKADLAVNEGKIVRVGRIEDGANEVIDADGLHVCPGFIDMHSHSDFTLLADPKAEGRVRQGVTTEVVGNCGDSAAPCVGSAVDRTKMVCQDHGIGLRWSSFSDYITTLEKNKVSVNVVPLVGHGTVRRCVMGVEGRDPTPTELDQMRRLVLEAMNSGAFGMSSGLVYAPGMSAKTNELIELCKVVAKYRGVYTSHIRGERETLIEAMNEAIEIGERSGVPIEISHHAPKIGAWGKSAQTLKMIDDARERGIDVTCDLQPYVGGIGPLFALLPPWVQEGGTEKIMSRVKDRVLRKKISDDMVEEKIPGPSDCGLVKRGMWNEIMISSHPKKEFVGKTIQEIAQERSQDPFDAYFDLALVSDISTTVTGFYYDEEDIRRVLLHTCSMIGSDAAGNHPRWYGTFPMFFRKYVRGETRKDLRGDSGEKVITCQELVRKMTSLPAQKLGLRGRGLLREGMWADIVVFNLEEIADKATYLQPNQYSKGVKYVVVNGRVVLEEEKHTGALPGRPLRHQS